MSFQSFAKIIRLRPIILDSANWGNLSGLLNLDLPNDPNLIMSFHYYDPSNFTSQCIDFSTGKLGCPGIIWEGTSDQAATIGDDFDKVANWAKKRNRPTFMGEFGSISAADLDSRIRWTIAVRDAAEKHGFSWGYWDLCDTHDYDGSLTFGFLKCYHHPLQASDWMQEFLQALIPKS